MSDNSTHELNLGREAIISFSSNAAMMAFGFFGVVLFANVLGPAGLGSYYLVLAGGKVLSQVTGGISGAIKKRISEAETDPREYFGLGLIAHITFTGCVIIVGILIRPFLKQILDVPSLVPSVVAIVFSFGFFQLSQSLYAGIGNPGYASWFDTARSVAMLLIQVAFLIIGWGALGLVAGFIAANIVTGILMWFATGVRPAIPSRSVISSTKSFAIWSTPTSLVTNLYGRLDVILIGVFVGNSAVGYYETALRLVQPAAFAANSIAGPLLVQSSMLSSQGSDVTASLKNALAYTSVLAVPILFGALAMPRALMQTVYGAEFGSAAPVLVGLALFQLLNAIQAPLSSFFAGSDRIRTEFSVSLGVFILYLPMALVLGYQVGLLGVVAATVISEVIRAGVYLQLSKRLLGEFVLTRPLFEQLVSGIVMYGIVWWIVAEYITISGWFWLLFVVFVGGLVYFSALLLVSSHFRMTLRENLPLQNRYL